MNMNFKKFQASRKHVPDLGAALLEGTLEKQSGFVYAGGLYINDPIKKGSKKYWTTIENTEPAGTLEVVEEALYDWAIRSGYFIEVPSVYTLVEVADGQTSSRVGIGDKGLKALLTVFKNCIQSYLENNEYSKRAVQSAIKRELKAHPDCPNTFSFSGEKSDYNVVLSETDAVYNYNQAE